MAEQIRSLDPTRLVTNGVNAALAVLDEVPAMLAELGANLNEMLADVGDSMNLLGSSHSVAQRTAESSSVLDVLGLNYAEGRYTVDQELFPHRVIVGSETFPSRIGTLWPMVRDHPNVIGDFTWTGWDYLGEVGIGATAYAEDETAVAAVEREFPYLTAWCGDLDITGWRRPVSYYREIVYGLRTEPYVAVRRPERTAHDVAMQTPWAWSDSVSSWTWPGHEGRPVTVEVYADADQVALLRDGTEVARTGLTTAAEPSLVVSADRTRLRTDDADLAFVAIELRDADEQLVTGADRPVTVQVSGAGRLAGLCSANPRTTERFDADTWSTFDGRALAVVRPTGEGRVEISVCSEGLELQLVTLDVGP